MLRRPLFALALFAVFASEAAAQTPVPGGNLVGSQTWTAAGSPYTLNGDVTVPAGTVLTIQAGTEIRFSSGDTQGSGNDTARTELRIAGTLAVQGTTASQVTFTSNAGSPATSDWYGVVLLAGANANISEARVRYGHRCIYDQSTGAVLASLTVENCGYGMEIAGGSPTISASRIQNNARPHHQLFGRLRGPELDQRQPTIRQHGPG